MKVSLQMVFTLLLEVVQAEDGMSGVRQENLLGEVLGILMGRTVLCGVLDDWLDGRQLDLRGELLVFGHN